MKIVCLAIGKPKLSYAAEGVREYEARLRHYAPFSIEYLKTRDESSALLNKSEGAYRIALDERGSQLSTREIAREITRLEDRGEIKSVAFLIGGANGHSPALREQCEATWSLSRMTMQHELALVVLLEQLYRAYTFKRGEPYHRE
ncbi:MAG: 50S rRNA methyltransferase [Roseibacillus sp.]|nr:50S rRNA methyltransferase [Roseibacillus sp.]